MGGYPTESIQRDRGFGYPTSPRPVTICDVAEEVMAAREKFPLPDALLAALVEEVGELAKAIMEEPRARIYAEAKQVASTAIRIMEESDPTLEALRKTRGAEVWDASPYRAWHPGSRDGGNDAR